MRVLARPRLDSATEAATSVLGCVHHLLEAQVARSPDAVAVIDRDVRLTYRRVDELANQTAHALRAAGVTVETPVGVACERSADMVVAVIAVLKAGGAYVPIDPGHPPPRIAALVEEARLGLVLTQARLAPTLAGLPSRTLCLEAGRSFPTSGPDVETHDDNAMYVLFTSGSTGRPKGVVGTHAAIASRLAWAQEVYPYADGEIACARTPLGFVDSVAEIFAPLAFGVPLVIVGAEAQREPARLIAELAAARVTRIVLVPPLLATLLALYPDLGARLPALRYWFLGGEAVPVALVDAFKRALPGRKLINIYGATEVSGDATYFDFDAMPTGLSSSPIGTPLSGVHARLVDNRLREVPDGETGEIVVSGVCLARGYLHRPDLTAERFVANPFPEGGTLYRMGDLGRRLPGGAIEYRGRLDQQVKIRGMRVELGDVEWHLAQVPGITRAVVVAETDVRGGRALVAYYSADREATATDVREAMARRVPDYMVPGRWIAVDRFPLTASGKIDRRRLGEHAVADAADAPPATNAERRVAATWEAVLERGPIGRTQHFLDVGGDSLSAMLIAAALGNELQVDVPVTAVLAHPTVAALAAHVASLAARPSTPPRAIAASGAPIPPVLPLSHFQLPFWLFHALTRDVSVVSEVFAFTREIDLERLQDAYADTIAGFDALWMAFPRWRAVQRIMPRRVCRFAIADHRDTTLPPAEVLQREADANNTLRFALDRPPLIHARLVRLRDGDRLLVAVPHVVADMTAMDLFRRALQARLAGTSSTPGAPHLGDLVAWERHGDSDRVADDVAYWAGVSTGPAWNTLPARWFTGKRAGRRARVAAARELPDDLAGRLVAQSRRRGMTLATTLIGSVYAALARVVDGDPTLLVVVDKRDHPATRELFTTRVSVMRCRVAGGEAATVDELADRVGAQLLASYARTDHLMRRPTLFNDFWERAPRALAWLVERASAWIARRWPDARLEPDALAQYVFAILPFPVPRTGATEVLVTLNVLPEVIRPDPPGDTVVRRRGLALLLKPGDLVINTDRMLDRTLQIVVTRNERGRIVVNLYGGGIDQDGLDELAATIVDVIQQLAEGRP